MDINEIMALEEVLAQAEITPKGYQETPYTTKLERVRTMGVHAFRAMGLAQEILYKDLEGLLSSNVAWTMASLGKGGDDRIRLEAACDCIRKSLSDGLGAEELREEIAPLLAAIRATESCIGRTHGDHPDWLFFVVDGEAGV